MVVTGASRGIGRATALAFAAQGCNVVLTSRKQEALDAVAEEITAAHPGVGVLAVAAHAAETEQDLYLSGRKDEAAAALPDELVRAVSLIGPEGYVAERIAAFREAGVTTLALQPLDDSRENRLRTVAKMRELCDR